jgi:hypothetical protein
MQKLFGALCGSLLIGFGTLTAIGQSTNGVEKNWGQEVHGQDGNQ